VAEKTAVEKGNIGNGNPKGMHDKLSMGLIFARHAIDLHFSSSFNTVTVGKASCIMK
jgi:hypothetical protein